MAVTRTLHLNLSMETMAALRRNNNTADTSNLLHHSNRNTAATRNRLLSIMLPNNVLSLPRSCPTTCD